MSLTYNPEVVKFPKPNSMHIIGLYLNGLISNLYGTSDINLNYNMYSIPIEF